MPAIATTTARKPIACLFMARLLAVRVSGEVVELHEMLRLVDLQLEPLHLHLEQRASCHQDGIEVAAAGLEGQPRRVHAGLRLRKDVAIEARETRLQEL